jgi:hypothetical protein
MNKPLGHKAYGSIPHLSRSRLGPGDHHIDEGSAKICTVKKRNKFDKVFVQEKLDGSCTAVARVDGQIVALGRAGWPARTSEYKQHHMFADWVDYRQDLFLSILNEGERLVGEWLAQAHGTKYYFDEWTLYPWGVFDLMLGKERASYEELHSRIWQKLPMPCLLHSGDALSISRAFELLNEPYMHWPCDGPEGVVYRVETKGEFNFICKWVREDKEDGKYFPENNNGKIEWNWVR